MQLEIHVFHIKTIHTEQYISLHSRLLICKIKHPTIFYLVKNVLAVLISQ